MTNVTQEPGLDAAGLEELREFAIWVETWACNPVSSYSVHALDGLFAMTRDRLNRLRAYEAHRSGAGEPVAWNDAPTAPKDGTLLRLLVVPDEEAHTSFHDSETPYETIGFNNLTDTGDDVWQFAGWDWSHDCITQGYGEVIGWLPFASPAKAGELETLRRERDEWRTRAHESHERYADADEAKYASEARARRMEEALREAQQGFSAIDWHIHEHSFSLARGIASQQQAHIAAALSDSPASAARPREPFEELGTIVSALHQSEAALSQSAPASMNGTQGENRDG